jgi:DNA primase
MVSNEAKGYRAYCFRCGPAGFVAHGDFSIDALKRRREELAWSNTKQVSLPKDFTTDIPPSEAVWLYKAGVGHTVSKHYGFGYSPSLRRVILPIYKDGVLQGYTARSTINERPKYIEKVVEPSATVFVSDPSIALPWSGDGLLGTVPDVLLCEDILSAVRVGRHVRLSIALLGTSATPRQLSLSDVRGTVGIWLDPDKAGNKGAKAIQRSLSIQGYETKLIRSAKDPKYYSNREIRRLLSST